MVDICGRIRDMQITGITPELFTQIVARVGAKHYEHNLDPQVTSVQSAKRFRARVVCYESGARLPHLNGMSAAGARRSWSGRRLNAACWHAYRDVLIGIFDANPDARVYTALASYKGKADFEAKYPATGYQNIGSMVQPAYMPDLCACEA